MIYICYGMTKSASTYLYQLTEEVLAAAGHTVFRIGRPGRGNRENYYDEITTSLLDRIESRAEGGAAVLKTHGRLDPAVAGYIASGRVKASATYRDPREVAMSMADNGARARKLGERAFSEIVRLEDTFPSIDQQLAYCAEWMAVPRLEAFSYNEICFSTGAAVARLCRQIGVVIDDRSATAPFQKRILIGQFNVARPLRYRDMDEAAQSMFLQRYHSFYAAVDLGEDLIEGTADLPAGRPRSAGIHRLEAALRLWRRMLKTKSLGTIL